MKKAKRPRSIFFRIVIACLAILLAGFCVLEAIIITGGRSSKDQSGDALIVLGAQVYHSGPSPVLKQRLQAALDYIDAHPDEDFPIIVSGAPGVRSASLPASMPSAAIPASMSCLRRSFPAPDSSRSKSSCNCSSVRFIAPNPFRSFFLSYASFAGIATNCAPNSANSRTATAAYTAVAVLCISLQNNQVRGN